MRCAVFFLFLVATVLASCHHDCYDQGECVEGSCVCYDSWAGSDCTIPFLPLNSGDVASYSISGDWIYFFTDITTNPSSMTYSMQDGLIGDCDLYIRLDEFPSKTHNDWSDNGWDSSSQITIDNPDTGRYIAGVYNFLACNFDLTLLIEETNNCPNDCSGNGICNIDNTCYCDSTFTGEDCSEEIVQLEAEAPLTEYVNHWEWKYYYYDSPEGLTSFQVGINQTQQDNADSDLYVKYGELPSLLDYDFRNAAILDDYALSVGSPMEGRYFIGVYGYGECEFMITLTETRASNCDNQCSSHGYCSNDVCYCESSFSGDNCEYMNTQLIEGQAVPGYAEDNQWNYYVVIANSASNMIITIDQAWNGGGDCDLYIQADSDPDRFHYDFRNVGFDDSFSVVVQNPLETEWHIGVCGYHSCQYYITEAIDAASCPNDCSGHGSCVNGRCACSSSYAGQDCASPLNRIHSGDVVSDTIGQNKWHYYKYTIPSRYTSVTLYLSESETVGYTELYVLEGAPPELSGYQFSNTELTANHKLYFRFDGSADIDHDFYVGVYGTSRVPLGSPVPYQLFAYSPSI